MLDQLQSLISNFTGKLIDFELEKIRGSTSSSSNFTLESLERNLKSLNSRASDIGKQIRNRELLGKRKRKREVENWLEEVQIIENEFLNWKNSEQEGIILRLFGGNQVQKLNSRVQELIKQSRDFGEVVVLDANVVAPMPLLTTRLFGKSFDENLKNMWEFLVIKRISSIGVYGMGGVGKTTLAKHFHNLLVEKSRYHVCWITISQQFTIHKLQDDLAKGIGLDISNEDDEEKRAAALNRALTQVKDFVIILDDMWEYIDLVKLGDPLRVTGCRLIVTTRLFNLCQRIGCRKNFEVKTLHAKEAWNMFRDILGNGVKMKFIDPEIHRIAKFMAKECGGLPLGIITLARSMKEFSDIHEWRNAYAELKEYPMEQDDMKNDVFRILKYSFNRLDPNYYQGKEKTHGYTKLQSCFLYCSLFPEDYKLHRIDIIHRFISEKLLDERKSRKEEFDQGHVVLNKLVSVCLLESDEEHSSVKMHDLIRAMALKITGANPKCFMVRARLALEEIPNEEEWTKDLEKVSLMHNNIRKILFQTSPKCPKISTLLLNENPISFIPKSFFKQMHGLCVLDLSHTHIKKLPKSLSDVESLKVLCLRECEMLVYVPYLGNLRELKELDLTRTKLKQLPRGIENLVKLKFLCLWGMMELEVFPKELLSRFSYIQHLSLPCHIEPPVEDIMKLKRLEEFSCTFKEVNNYNMFVKNQIGDGLLSFCDIKVGEFNYFWEMYRYIDEKINGKRVVLEQCSFGDNEGKGLINMLPMFTQHLVLSNCKGLSKNLVNDLSRLERANSLRICELSQCNGVESILTMKENKDHDDCNFSVHNIEEFWLMNLPNLIHFVKWEKQGVVKKGMLSSLRKLNIEDCHQIENMGLTLMEFNRIEEITIVRCEKIEAIVEVVGDEKRDVIFLPKLKKLCLAMLPSLKSICEETIACDCIEEIDLYSCSNLRKLPLFMPFIDGQILAPSSLKQIRMYPKDKEWWESLKWENPEHSFLLQPFVRFW